MNLEESLAWLSRHNAAVIFHSNPENSVHVTITHNGLVYGVTRRWTDEEEYAAKCTVSAWELVNCVRSLERSLENAPSQT